ncbi:MAG: DUF1801 domain-containing protein [Phycisphaerales bacterium]|nr:DUF1801 domain-containing protein [Phycisphaerales bacterium]
MRSQATTIEAYLQSLPPDRREAIQAVRDVINRNIDKQYAEGMQYGMPAWFVPRSVYPAGYHCDPKQPVPFASVASQKNHVAIYMFCIYCLPGEAEWFAQQWKATGKRLDMGKGCVRFKRLEDVPLDLIGEAVRRATITRFLEHYESVVKPGGRSGSASKGGGKPASKKTASKTSASKKSASKKTSSKKSASKSAPGKKAPSRKPASKKTVRKAAAKKAARRAPAKKKK